METVYIGFGGNLGDPAAAIRGAAERIRAWPEVRGLRLSSLYRTAAEGPGPQPDYLNAAAVLRTALPPEEVLVRLLALEAEYGRVRTLRWGPRTLDLDLLLHGHRTLRTPDLTLPHPRICARGFVLAPLAELAPRGRHPEGTFGALYRQWRLRTPDADRRVVRLPDPRSDAVGALR